jgi:hypothetical protein
MLFHLKDLVVPSYGWSDAWSAEPWLFCEHFEVIPVNVISRPSTDTLWVIFVSLLNDLVQVCFL